MTERPSTKEANGVSPYAQELLTYKECAELGPKSLPYVIECAAVGKSLTYFGTSHPERDPQNLEYGAIILAFRSAQPDIVFVEGLNGEQAAFDSRLKHLTHDKIIEQMGESGFMAKLAQEAEVPWRCPEPGDEEVITRQREAGFTQSEIFSWFVMRMLPQYYRQMERTGFPAYVERFIQAFQKKTNWEGFDYSYEYALSYAEEELGRGIDVENEPNFITVIEPTAMEYSDVPPTVFNRIGSATSRFRDERILTELIIALETYDRIFAVYGATHVEMQEPALRKYFEDLDNKEG